MAGELIEHEEVRIGLTLLADILAEVRGIRKFLHEEDDGEEEEEA